MTQLQNSLKQLTATFSHLKMIYISLKLSF